MTRLFYTTGNCDIIEEEWIKPEIKNNEIEVKSIYTGVCRSDIDMYCGSFQTLPKYIQGHEGMGVVTKVGKELTDIKEGDYVATRGEPAFSDYYNCASGMFVKVEEADPKYILEPIACGINISRGFVIESNKDILLLGSGFLAKIVYTMIDRYYENKFVVVGDANTEFWKKCDSVELKNIEQIRGEKFNYIIDLSDKPEYLELDIYAECAKIVIAAEKHPKASISFSQFLWNAVDIKFPSPRNSGFHSAMKLAEMLVCEGVIDTSELWTKSYNRETEVKLAFEEGLNRPANYSRGYIEWQR